MQALEYYVSIFYTVLYLNYIYILDQGLNQMEYILSLFVQIRIIIRIVGKTVVRVFDSKSILGLNPKHQQTT